MITPWQKHSGHWIASAVDMLACLEPAQGSLYSAAMQAVSMLWHLFTSSLTPASTKISNSRVRHYIFYASSTGFVKLLNWADTNEYKIILCKASLPGLFLLVWFLGLFTDRINQHKLELLQSLSTLSLPSCLFPSFSLYPHWCFVQLGHEKVQGA